MHKLYRLVPALMLLAGCHVQARAPGLHPTTMQDSDVDLLAACDSGGLLKSKLAGDLAQGLAPEASALGKCVADAARNGSSAAAILLAGLYREAMSEGGGATYRGPAHGGSAALGLDLFGRHIGWLHLAADQGYAPAQLLLAQETDGAATSAMPDMTLAWYQAAAQNGNRPALAAIGSAYANGRIPYERLYDFRSWLSRQTDPAPPYGQMLRLLTGPAAKVLPS